MVLAWVEVDLDDEDRHAERYEGDPQERPGLADLLDELCDPPAWKARAACRGMGPDPFYPERGQSLEPAREVCAGCEVRSECMADALDTPVAADYGVWGGTSSRQRRRLRRTAA